MMTTERGLEGLLHLRVAGGPDFELDILNAQARQFSLGSLDIFLAELEPSHGSIRADRVGQDCSREAEVASDLEGWGLISPLFDRTR